MVLCTDRANSGARAVDGEMCPCHQIAVGGLAPRVTHGCLLVMAMGVVLGVAGCRAASLGRILGCGVGVVSIVCIHAGRQWIGDLCLSLEGVVALRSFG